MNLRCFLTIFAILCAAIVPSRSADGSSARQYYELRVYTTQNEKQQALINDYWQKAGIPAYNRAGVEPIGVFTETQDSPTNKVYVLIPFNSLSAFESLPARFSLPGSPRTALFKRPLLIS
jgi:hypothetical protein